MHRAIESCDKRRKLGEGSEGRGRGQDYKIDKPYNERRMDEAKKVPVKPKVKER